MRITKTSTTLTTAKTIICGLVLLLSIARTSVRAITAPIHWYVGIEAMAEELYGPLEDIFANPSPCTFRFPPGCDSSTCIFLGKWRSEQLSTGGIVVHFLIASLALGPNRWLGVGFSADRNMPHSDAIIAGMDTSGQRLYVSDRWISGYSSPVKDHVDNIINWEWKQESNMTIFYFVRRADTGDYDQDVDLFTDMQRCLFFHFPYSGGEYSEVTDTIGKHYVTPVTIGPICSDRCEDIPTDFELVHGYCAEDFIHPANPLAPVSIADCLTLCQRLSNCLSGAYNADNSRCLLRTSTCSLSRAVDVGRNWYTYNKKSAMLGPQTLGNLGAGALPPWAVPLYPGGPTPLTLPPFPLFPQVPPVPGMETETGELETATEEPGVGMPSSELLGNDTSLVGVSGFENETSEMDLNMTHEWELETNETLVAEKTPPPEDIMNLTLPAVPVMPNVTGNLVAPEMFPTEMPSTLPPIDLPPKVPDLPPPIPFEPEVEVDQGTSESHHMPEIPPPIIDQPPMIGGEVESFHVTDAPVAAPEVDRNSDPYYPPPPPPPDPEMPPPSSGNFVFDNYEDTGTHCKGSSLGDLPENWNVDQCARECSKRPACIGFTIDRTRNSEPHLCILKAKGCENIGPHSVWSFYRRLNMASSEPAPAETHVDNYNQGSYSHQEIPPPPPPPPSESYEIHSSTPLSHFEDTGEHCKGGAIDSSYLDMTLEQCAKECVSNPQCGGFSWDRTSNSPPYKCIAKLPSCEMAGPHSFWTFYRKHDSSSRSSGDHHHQQQQHQHGGDDYSSQTVESRSAARPAHPPVSEESRRIFTQFFNAVDGGVCEGTPIVSLPVPNKEACATECYNHPKCLGFSIQIGRDQPPLECQLNAQRCWHPNYDPSFKFFNRGEEMSGGPQSQGAAHGGGFVIHDGMCLDQTGEFWVDNKAQCADRCIVDTNCQGYSFTANGNMCRLIFSFDCNGAQIFRRLAEDFTTQRHGFEDAASSSNHAGSSSGLAPRCHLPPDTGPCKANLRRWFYNSNQCEEFVFGGCEGNNNNFLSLDECEQHCPPSGPRSSSHEVGGYNVELPPEPAPAEFQELPPPMETADSGAGGASIIGYKSLHGNCPGHVLQEIFQPMTLESCADRCNNAPTCAGFAFAQEDAKCVLKDGPCKNPNPHKFIYYTKL